MIATVALTAVTHEATGTDARALAFADFHCHTRHSRDSRLSEQRFVELALERGLTHVAVTDHNTIDGSVAVRRRAEELGVADQLTVILGEEVSSADGEIVGLFIETTVPPGLSAEETADAIHDQGGLVAVPHPFDPFRRSHLREDALERMAATGRIDAVEVFNSRVTLARHNQQAAEFAARHQIPGVACSDSHTVLEVAMSFNALPAFTSAEELRAALPRNEWHGSRTTKLVHLGTRWAVASKWVARRTRPNR
ncbi:MAG: PHP domain-containing protein [Candidatus Limnocylindria bacterium]